MQVDLLLPLLRRLERDQPFSRSDRQTIFSMPFSVKQLGARRYLVREGDLGESLIAIKSGALCRHKFAGDGGRQILGVYVPGDILDLGCLLPDELDHNVQALTAAEIIIIPRSAIVSLTFERPRVGTALVRELLVDAAIAREWVLNIGRRKARTRVAHLLCELIRRLKPAESDYHLLDLPLTQIEIADATGLTPVHVNRVLQALRAERIISPGRHSIAVLDWSELQRIGDFDECYLHCRTVVERQDDEIVSCRGPSLLGI